MGDVHRGKELFRQRVEYPLPKAAGVRDYVFYIVPPGDGYRDAGNRFFRRFYPDHRPFDVRSLEDLVGVLAGEADGDVARIREVVILAHGNPLGMLFPVLNGVTGTTLAEYKYLTAFALACLQRDLAAGKFPALAARRKKVLAKLGAESVITLRVCNFGRSREGMYALFAFFGGRANVYAPVVYQFFGTPPIAEGMRLENRLRVHEHLSKQHFHPKDVHTAERRDAIVTAIVDPGRFSEPFEIASMRLDTPDPAYEAHVTALDARRIGAALKAAFAARDFTLTAKASVTVRFRGSQWTIDDMLRHEGSDFRVVYDLWESVEFDDRDRRLAVLRAAASLDDKPSGRDTVPIQLFFTEEDNQAFRGRRLVLAAYADEPDARPEAKARFEAVKAVLSQGALSGGSVDVRADLREQAQVELGAGATLVRLSATGSGDTERITWAIRDAQRFKVVLEHRPMDGGGQRFSHAITVYDDYADKRALIMAQYETVAAIGADSDTPGTELAAYLDRQGFDDLLNLLAFLRTPYRTENAFYIQRVQEALARRKEFRAWVVANVPIVTDSVLGTDPFTGLSLSEDRDYGEGSYKFAFNAHWSEVQASNPPPAPVQADLFAEEDLAKKFGIPEPAMTERTALADIDPDSPAADIEALRALERVGFERYFSAEKTTPERTPEVLPPGCADFEAIIAKWEEVKHLEPEAQREALEGAKTPDGVSYWDVLKGFKTHAKAWMKILDVSVPALDWVVMSKKDLAKLVAKRTPFLARIFALQLIVEIEFVFTIPFAMFMEFADAQVEMRAVWYARGRVTVVRQWLRAVLDLTYLKEADFPQEIEIDLGSPAWRYPLYPYWLGHYMDEVVEQGQIPTHFVPAPDRLKDGYDDQLVQMGLFGIEFLRAADEIIEDLLRDADLDPCRVEVLRRTGHLDLSRHRAVVVRALVRDMLDKLAKV